MARVFNIYFTCENTTHNAIVSVRQTAFFTEFTLKFPDEGILNKLPGDVIISREKNDFIFKNAPNTEPTPLMQEIIRAVAGHLHAVSSN